jgi:D-glycero-D-manno-heptose 1,7-bisphosphate phosphatase
MNRNDPRLFIFDADGTLRWTRIAGQPYPLKPGDWALMPGVADRLRTIDWNAHRLAVATNQNGVALGELREEDARGMIAAALEEAIGFLPGNAIIEMCVCHPDAGCSCRKPAPGLLCRILDRTGIPAGKALYVGDLDIDQEAAGRAGVPFRWASEFFGGSRSGSGSSPGSTATPPSGPAT